MKLLKYLDRSIWALMALCAALLAGYGISVLAWFWGSQPFCSKDEACLREWVSALSGYFALAAAFVTIMVMNRQRAEALQIQKENVELQIMGRLATARAYRIRLLSIQAICQAMGSKPPTPFISAQFTEKYNYIQNVIEGLEMKIIHQFEMDIGVQIGVDAIGLPHARTAAELTRQRTLISPYASLPNHLTDAQLNQAHDIAFGQCLGYAEMGIFEADRFIAKWANRIG